MHRVNFHTCITENDSSEANIFYWVAAIQAEILPVHDLHLQHTITNP